MLQVSEPLTAAEIIRTLGGPTAIAQDSEIPASRKAVGNWSHDGIPGKYWPALARRAERIKDAGHITLAELERHVCPRKQAEAI